jgi:2-iminobutanoate/2-iminopropanoate deaminase
MSSSRQAVYAPKAPKMNGNYSHAIRSGNTLHISGRMGDDPTAGGIVNGGIQPQTVKNALNL